MIGRRGISLMETIVAALVAALIIGGTMMAFVLAAMISKRGGSNNVEAALFVQQSLERFRNHIACDDSWFNPASCAGTGVPAWTPDALPAAPPGSSSSVLPYGASRQYRVEPADCDGVGGPGDCFKVTAKVDWNPPQ